MSLRRNLLCAVLLAAAAACWVWTASAHAAFGVTEVDFEAGTCNTSSCTYASIEADHAEAFTQAAGHPPWGITTFELNHHSGLLGKEPEGDLRRVRVDVPAGLAADPQALPPCARSRFEAGECLPESKVGTTEMTVYVSGANATISGNVYNLPPEPGLPLLFGIEVAPAGPLVSPVRLYLEGHVAWSSDYHEYFEINNIPDETEIAGGMKATLQVLKSKLNFNGNAGEGNFLTLPSVCSASTESHLEVESWSGEISRTATHTPVGVEGCGAVPFSPSASVTPASATYDEPDGATVVVSAPQNLASGEINTSDIREAHVSLPEGMTINPAAANGLAACTPAQIGIGTTDPVSCPQASRIGTVAIETDLPPHSLSGPVYLGGPPSGPITGPPFTVYLDAESVYGVSVRLKGLVYPNPSTGRLEASFTENPQLPFSELVLTMNGGPRAPLANPLGCGSAPTQYSFAPYSGGAAAGGSSLFASGGCPSSVPFSWAQASTASPASAGAFGSTSFTFQLARGDGEQYLAHVSTELPAGVVGAIPSVPLCGEPAAAQGSCPAASQIGTATASVGAGSEPYSFTGPVYLTDGYAGAPFGLSIPTTAAVGPFDFGSVVTRAAVGVDPTSARVTVSSSLPTIVAGVPLRLRSLSVTVERSDFLYNPTSCGALADESTLQSTWGADQQVSSTLSVGDCGALKFTPSFSASSNEKTSKQIGAGLTVKVTQGAHQANIHSVLTQLPGVFAIRDTTLKQACVAATYAASPAGCPPGSVVGSATATTPVLAGTLKGQAILVSHGGEAFPDIDVVLEGDGVRVALVGNTHVSLHGIITTNFASLPDVPITSFQLTLPTGPHSLLSPNGNLCAKAISMPTTITAQSGAQLKRETPISVAGCPAEARSNGHRLFRILSTRLHGHTLLLKIRAFMAGRLSVGGADVAKKSSRKLAKPKTVTVAVTLTRKALRLPRGHRMLKLHALVTLKPAKHKVHSASATASLEVRR